MSLLLIVCCALMVDPQVLIDDRVDYTALDGILAVVVSGERVDYQLLREKHLDGLRAVLGRMNAVDSTKLNRQQQLAYYINLYNTTVLLNVAERYVSGYSVAENDHAIFKEPLVRTAEGRTSLNELEGRIRRQFGDARIHAALNCAAVSCPPLLPRAYRDQDLDQVLEQNMRAFVNDATRNRIDSDNKRLQLSRVFEWYADDFGGKDKLAAYVSKYLDKDVKGWELSFMEYSWDMNDVKR